MPNMRLSPFSYYGADPARRHASMLGLDHDSYTKWLQRLVDCRGYIAGQTPVTAVRTLPPLAPTSKFPLLGRPARTPHGPCPESQPCDVRRRSEAVRLAALQAPRSYPAHQTSPTHLKPT